MKQCKFGMSLQEPDLKHTLLLIRRIMAIFCVNGAAAHLVSPGDLVIIARFIWLDEAECKNFEPKVIFVDSKNQIKSIKASEAKIHVP